MRVESSDNGKCLIQPEIDRNIWVFFSKNGYLSNLFTETEELTCLSGLF